MDKNSIIGLLLIGAILIGFSIYNAPTENEIAAQKRQQDSIEAVQKLASKQKQQAVLQDAVIAAIADTTTISDSTKNEVLKSTYGPFIASASGERKISYIENELIKVGISNKGGRIVSVQLKKYRTHDSLPLLLCDEDSSRFGLSFIAQNRVFSTDTLYFTPVGNSFTVNGTDSNKLSMRLQAAPGKYLEFEYRLKGNSYLMDCNINTVGMQDLIASNTSDLNLKWKLRALKHEKSHTNEQNATTIYYKHFEDEVDYLNEAKDGKESFKTKMQWVSFKQQYFTSVLIAKKGFEKPTEIETIGLPDSKKYTKDLSASFTIPYEHKASESFAMNIYFGPNHYGTLKGYGLDLEQQVPLGWGIFGWVNRFAVIPVFNFLSGFNINFGIIILLLTILIKVVLLPLTYKAYMSTAKMKVLKPEVDELNEKYAKEEPMKKQQALMALYKKAGVNPLGGCLPMLLQMPILIAMFRFFPASIELRQQSFLWATDLSSYDSIWTFGYVPVIDYLYGDHVSLFTLLMTISTIMYTRMNDQFSGANNPQMAQMKWIMYLMPIIFLGVFNNYSAGLSYYYFLANMFTFAQQWIIRKLVDEDAIHAKIQENKKKPAAPKSKFQARLEEMAKQRATLPQGGKKK
ncbi:MAG: membrane protein insertase YidC [Bacteroidetes bacterium]|nr:membrane protein insertase YidC [Bacteroidota bacterium]MBK9673146.1 membrane protein insertase YidC [Bacteroidota bacterium]MBK9798728.1 membrane protein insertase YidC [Bacteroidota bacterium]MBP6412671.1 membrane protein insertase YidC [Bacteroidia bacterium]